jgi:hypothetical protein
VPPVPVRPLQALLLSLWPLGPGLPDAAADQAREGIADEGDLLGRTQMKFKLITADVYANSSESHPIEEKVNEFLEKNPGVRVVSSVATLLLATREMHVGIFYEPEIRNVTG